ncbi:lysosomal Pro-X carboxypeptidase [Cephus cinctus]|uniref:Lysosomal Pro-X carboxypeptidase n=1 Tax=Cephus cinctus TaxID=211228 RepID=A0AAJ7CGZ6_CEPCN|nr:lysosomal Pro-X carboxypeptidase [Cephus cinctus]
MAASRAFILILFLIYHSAIGLKYNTKPEILRSLLSSGKTVENNTYIYKTKTFEVLVDHFSFSVTDTFKLRYLVNDTWQRGNNAPIFFYTGNEGFIETFAQNTGLMWDIAPQFGALLIFAEHRYYGESMPFGNKSFSDAKHMGYLTSQQAMADYIDLINYLRSDTKTKHSPVIVFGGSYGGMLSAWIRMKYPHIVQGAIAASAPILQFSGVTPCEAFARIVTSDFRAAHHECSNLIRKSWYTITNVTSSDEGKKWFKENWKLCSPLVNATHVRALKSWLSDIYGNLAMVNYPYEANFLAPLPGYPITAVCKHLVEPKLEGKPLLLALKKAINVYTNFTGKTECLSIDNAAPNLGDIGWSYQACTEMVMPMCNDGINDMFEPEPWDFKEYSDQCYKDYNIRPRLDLACTEYGCKDLSAATNIVFSNGLLDPWSSGGVFRNLSSSTSVIIIPEGAHHLDLRASNPRDPVSVINARKYHRSAIKKWIKEYRDKFA